MTGTASAKPLPFAALRLYVEPRVSVSLKLRSVGLLVRRREKSSWALNTPKGNQDYLKGKHNGKSFGSDVRNKLILAEERFFFKGEIIWTKSHFSLHLSLLIIFCGRQDPCHTQLLAL